MTSAYEYDLIVIGSGPAGQSAAIQAAKLGRRVALVEKRTGLGGVSTHLGTLPSKTFREAVLALKRDTVQRALHAAGADPIKLTMPMLLDRVQSVIDEEQQLVREKLARNDVTIVRGFASFVDANTISVDSPAGDRHMTTSFIMLACGTRPVIPAGCPDQTQEEHPRVITSDNVSSLTEIPKTMIVVGGGVVGIEYASFFAELGTRVTLVERTERPISFMDHETIEEMIHSLRILDMIFRCQETVTKIACVDESPRRVVIELASGKRMAADVALISAGRQGCTEGLHLECAGLAADARGRIEVDDCYRTKVPSIFAAGDLIGFPALSATSAAQGRIAACHMFGEPVAPMGDDYPFGIYAIPELSSAGASEQKLTAEKVPYEIGIARYSEIARGKISSTNDGFLKLIFHRDTRLLLGVHILGSNATELVHVGQAVLRLKGGLDFFLSNVYNYPTYGECYKVAALNASNNLRNNANLGS
ncbi:MAG: Si-specific NAD(P)(+) transhydrogenase [Phycisphaerales bacterium]|nr:Si-specific NAD(P)(+) transhydrogenase [Phycisphaerales bacterium]